jgi:RNA polymerase sigma-70 factor (ECF subfamily)
VALQERKSLNQRLFGALRGLPAAPAGEETLHLPEAVTVEAHAPANSEEAKLVEAARRDPEAFGVLYEAYVDRIYAYIYHRVGNVQDAEDLTARTFYRALDSLDSYEDRGAPFSAWLFRIAHNLVANWHRDHSRRRFLSLDRLWFHSQEDDSPQHKLEQEETNAALWSAINRLPEERRNLLLYKFGSQLSNLEIGDLMNKSESAVKSLYFRTLAALRKDLEARGWGIGQPSGHDFFKSADLKSDNDRAGATSPEEAGEESGEPGSDGHSARVAAQKEVA